MKKPTRKVTRQKRLWVWVVMNRVAGQWKVYVACESRHAAAHWRNAYSGESRNVALRRIEVKPPRPRGGKRD